MTPPDDVMTAAEAAALLAKAAPRREVLWYDDAARALRAVVALHERAAVAPPALPQAPPMPPARRNCRALDEAAGWECVSMHDPTGRRGVWYRHGGGAVEVCAGREGDDGYARLSVGQTLTLDDVGDLVGCLATGADQCRDHGPQEAPQCPEATPDGGTEPGGGGTPARGLQGAAAGVRP